MRFIAISNCRRSRRTVAVLLAALTCAHWLAFETHAQPSAAVALVVSDYKGADDAGSSLLEEMMQRSVGKLLFVLFYNPSPVQQRVVGLFSDAKKKSSLDYELLLVNTSSHPKTWRKFHPGLGSPWSAIYFMRHAPPFGRLPREPKDVEDVLKFVEAIQKLPPAMPPK